jgi:hypothetical protein
MAVAAELEEQVVVGGERGIMGARYGTVRGVAALRELIEAGAREAWRLSSTGILVKVADHARQGEHQPLTGWIKATIPMALYTDLHAIRSAYLRDGKHCVTQVPSSNDATYLVFRKVGHRHVDFHRVYARQ